MAAEQSIWSRLFGRNQSEPAQTTYMPMITSTTRTGETIDPEKALKNSTVFSCVNVIADNIAQLPWGVYSESEGNVQRITSQRVENVLRKPNDINTPYEIKHAIVSNILLYGNAYLLVVRDASGRVVSMTPLDPSKVTPAVNTAGRSVFIFKENGAERTYRASSIIHFRDFASWELNGLSRVEQCADLIAQANAIEYLSSDVFRNGNGVGGVISSEASIPPDVQERLIAAWNGNFGGQKAQSRGGLAVLGGGLEYTPFNPLKPTDADLQAMKRLVIAQICGVFRVPTQYVELGDNNKYNNVSQKQTSFFRDTIAPMVRNIEERINIALMEGDRGSIKFDVTDIQRGDRQTQMNIAVSGVSNGILTPNEAREYLEMNRSDQEGADELRLTSGAPEMPSDNMENDNDSEEN